MSKNPAPRVTSPILPEAGEHIRFVIVPRFNMATLITLIEPLRVANYLAASPRYSWEILSMDGDDVAASNGMTLAARAAGDPASPPVRRGDVVFVLASWGAEQYRNKALFSWLRRQSRARARLCAVELGSYLVARAGLLADQPVATHWSWAAGFQEQFPDLAVTEALYTDDTPVLTCAGGLAGVDLMLRLMAGRHGRDIAAEVADQMLHHPQRPPDAPQRRQAGEGDKTLAAPTRAAIALMETSLADPLTVPLIAARLGLSQRQLERHFHRDIGCTVIQYATLLRLQHARVLLISTALSVREIAAAAGFNSLSHFAFAFRQCFGRKPSDYRQGWPSTAAAPNWPGTLAAYLDGLAAKKAQKPSGKGRDDMLAEQLE
jgi:transcriptional regulator GlxA family with amidase domain